MFMSLDICRNHPNKNGMMTSTNVDQRARDGSAPLPTGYPKQSTDIFLATETAGHETGGKEKISVNLIPLKI